MDLLKIAFCILSVMTFSDGRLIVVQGFNKELEAMAHVQKGYAIPDSDLRQQLIIENKEFLLPQYQAFYNKYSVLNFTKNRSKYVKYDVDSVAKLLDTFFDASA